MQKIFKNLLNFQKNQKKIEIGNPNRVGTGAEAVAILITCSQAIKNPWRACARPRSGWEEGRGPKVPLTKKEFSHKSQTLFCNYDSFHFSQLRIHQ